MGHSWEIGKKQNSEKNKFQNYNHRYTKFQKQKKECKYDTWDNKFSIK